MRRAVDEPRLRAFMRELAAESRAAFCDRGARGALLPRRCDAGRGVRRPNVRNGTACAQPHRKDLDDAARMVADGLVQPETLRELFEAIAPQLYRYPAINPPTFRAAVQAFLARR